MPVVFFTSQTDVATTTRAKRTDPAGYVVKPFEPEQIAEALRAAMERPSAAPVERPGRPSLDAAPAPTGPSTILFVDDQEHTQASMMSGVPRGQRVKLAGSFDAATDILQKQGFNLIVINIDLPDADGGSSIRDLRQVVGTEIPIIAIAERVSPTLAAFVKESVSVLLQSAQVEARLEAEVNAALGL